MKYLRVLARMFYGLMAAMLGCIAAQGNGLPKVTYFFLGAVVIPMIAYQVAKQFGQRRWVEMVVLIIGGFCCTSLAFWSSRRSPEEIFRHVFSREPLGSITHLEGRKQYSDGFIWLLSFEIGDDDFKELIDKAHITFEDQFGENEVPADNLQGTWYLSTQPWASIAYNYWPKITTVRHAKAYRASKDVDGDRLKHKQTTIFRDIETKRIWVVDVED